MRSCTTSPMHSSSGIRHELSGTSRISALSGLEWNLRLVAGAALCALASPAAFVGVALFRTPGGEQSPGGARSARRTHHGPFPHSLGRFDRRRADPALRLHLGTGLGAP